MSIRDRYVWVCGNRRPDGNPRGSCAQKGSESLRDQLKIACANAGLQKSVRVMSSSCIDECDRGIVLAVMPDDAVIGDLTEADVPSLVEGLKTAGGVRTHPSLAAKVIPRITASDERKP
jgi:predicted metal-binding protein